MQMPFLGRDTFFFLTERANLFFLRRLKNLYGFRLVFEFELWVPDFPFSFSCFVFSIARSSVNQMDYKEFDFFCATWHSCMLKLMAEGSHMISIPKSLVVM